MRKFRNPPPSRLPTAAPTPPSASRSPNPNPNPDARIGPFFHLLQDVGAVACDPRGDVLGITFAPGKGSNRTLFLLLLRPARFQQWPGVLGQLLGGAGLAFGDDGVQVGTPVESSGEDDHNDQADTTTRRRIEQDRSTCR